MQILAGYDDTDTTSPYFNSPIDLFWGFVPTLKIVLVALAGVNEKVESVWKWKNMLDYAF